MVCTLNRERLNMMTYEEFKALEDLLGYIDQDGWSYLDSDRLTNILGDYIKGHYSTETNPQGSV